MRGLNSPRLAILLMMVACVCIHYSIRITDKITFKEAKKSIVLTKEEQAGMVRAFADGSAYTSGATSPPRPTPPSVSPAP
ncbi:MAG: hypothetical protein IK083_06610 [Abditibacteriota bacterium]|nr:hypothetical protein [Abditibacteriota bacterium]